MREGQSLPPDVLELLEKERARKLRRRFLWYCAAVLALVALSFWGSLDEQLNHNRRPPTDDLPQSIDYLIDVFIAVLHGIAVACVIPARRTRAQIVNCYTLVTVLAGAALVGVTPFADNSSVIASATPGPGVAAAVAQQFATLLVIFLVHVLGSLLIALSPREGLRLLIPLLLVYMGQLWAAHDLYLHSRIFFTILAPLVGLPGFLWSWWRHRGFTDRFVQRTLAHRYGEISSELADARRVHEALFPPPLDRGPVRVHYTYDPMREIGGDFLYMHPLSFPPTTPDSRISVVLLDVTGHGVPAALAVNRVYVELSRLFSEGIDHPPHKVIAELNRIFFETLATQSMFGTATCIRLDPGAATGAQFVEWCGAGHPPALLVRGGGEIVRLEAGSPMLGALEPGAFPAATSSTPMAVGDILVAYTDGTIESADATGRMLGINGMADVVRSAAAQHPGGDGRICTAVVSAIETYRKGPTRDDILVIEIARVGSDAAASTPAAPA